MWLNIKVCCTFGIFIPPFHIVWPEPLCFFPVHPCERSLRTLLNTVSWKTLDRFSSYYLTYSTRLFWNRDMNTSDFGVRGQSSRSRWNKLCWKQQFEGGRIHHLTSRMEFGVSVYCLWLDIEDHIDLDIDPYSLKQCNIRDCYHPQSRMVLFAALSVADFVCQCYNSWTVRTIITNFSGHHSMVKRKAKYINGYVGVPQRLVI